MGCGTGLGGGLAVSRSASVNVRGVEVLVLDEADRLLEMGFEKDIRTVCALRAFHSDTGAPFNHTQHCTRSAIINHAGASTNVDGHYLGPV